MPGVQPHTGYCCSGTTLLKGDGIGVDLSQYNGKASAVFYGHHMQSACCGVPCRVPVPVYRESVAT